MPSENEKQRRLAGMALAIKRGDAPKSSSPQAAKMAASMTKKELREFAAKPVKGKK